MQNTASTTGTDAPETATGTATTATTATTDPGPVTDRVPAVDAATGPDPLGPPASGPGAAGTTPDGAGPAEDGPAAGTPYGAVPPGAAPHGGAGSGPRAAGIGDRVAAFRLRRSGTDRMLGGVCGGLAADLGVDAALLRIAVLALTLLTGGAAALVYLAAWLIAPVA
ncbi:PspC domain-containing protein [Pseudonocardia sp. ICBG1293]|uniref:PspC domain-containing protein n=1 Tax=Pseudonocardia sp. ICBG1293 TaxID=2844382 RepID=UPI0027E0C20E|nr:PspC domain-containing protein [Pseudonocardia sp. ICBG1293]